MAVRELRGRQALVAGTGLAGVAGLVITIVLGAFRLVQRTVEAPLQRQAAQRALQVPGLTTPATPISQAPPGPPGPVVGPTFGRAAHTRSFQLDGLDFTFRAPATWSCARTTATPPDVSWLCFDSSGQPAIRPGGWVIERPCPQPCDASEQARLRESVPKLPAGADWHQTDASTWYVDYLDTLDGAPRYRLFMTHFWQGHQVAAALVAPQSQAAPLQEIVNDVRSAT